VACATGGLFPGSESVDQLAQQFIINLFAGAFFGGENEDESDSEEEHY
jgi:hypothetical protein